MLNIQKDITSLQLNEFHKSTVQPIPIHESATHHQHPRTPAQVPSKLLTFFL